MEKYYKCGREQSLLSENTIQSLRTNKSLPNLHRILGTGLFIEWLYTTNFITFAEYKEIRVHALNPYEYYNGQG
jgi:hypothetical protein